MFLLLGRLGDLNGEEVSARRRMDRQRHLAKLLRISLLGGSILGGRLRAARGEGREREP